MKRTRSYRIPRFQGTSSGLRTNRLGAGPQATVGHAPGVCADQSVVQTYFNAPAFTEQHVLAALIDTTDALLWVLDVTGRIVFFNQACEHVTGYTAQEVIGTRRWENFLLPAERHNAITTLANQWLDRIALTGTVVWRSRHGTEWHLLWSVKLLRNQVGAITHLLCTAIILPDTPPASPDLAAPQPPRIPRADDERLALAREIHDGPLHDVHQIHHQLVQLRSADSPHDHAALAAAQQSTHTAIHALRQLCTDLRPPTLALLGLTPAIRAHARELHHAYPQLQIQLLLHDDGTVLAESIRLHLYRIYQAALSNVLRHAQAGCVTVEFTWDAEQVCLTVFDNGQGFQLPAAWQAWAQAGCRYGLLGMHERAQLCGGSCHIHSTPGGGTTVQVCVPGVVVALPRTPT